MVKLVDVDYDDVVSCCWSTANSTNSNGSNSGTDGIDIYESTYDNTNMTNERLYIHSRSGARIDLFEGASGKLLSSLPNIAATGISTSVSGNQLLVCNNNEVSVMLLSANGTELHSDGPNTIPFEGVCEEEDGGMSTV